MPLIIGSYLSNRRKYILPISCFILAGRPITYYLCIPIPITYIVHYLCFSLVRRVLSYRHVYLNF